MAGHIFTAKPYKPTTSSAVFSATIKRKPFLFFGLPFIVTIVAASFGLSQLTQTRYDQHDHKIRAMRKEEALGMDKNRRKLSLQEEYWRLQKSADTDNWEQVRITRPPGVEQ